MLLILCEFAAFFSTSLLYVDIAIIAPDTKFLFYFIFPSFRMYFSGVFSNVFGFVLLIFALVVSCIFAVSVCFEAPFSNFTFAADFVILLISGFFFFCSLAALLIRRLQ